MPDYKQIIHERGDKQGQSYYGHVIDLASIASKLCPVIDVNATEIRCVLLALTIHDINKIPPHNKRPNGKEAKYADAAAPEHIWDELERLEVDAFFPEWRDYHLHGVFARKRNESAGSAGERI